MAALSSAGAGDSAAAGLCLVSGESDELERLHPSIKGVWGAQSSGANIVSFNLDAFRSYAKEQGANAPVGKRAAFAYTTALNHLLAKGSKQRIQVGDASTVFWAEKPGHSMETLFPRALGEAERDDPDIGTDAVKALLAAPHSGAEFFEDGDTRFYVLGLAPNAARIAVRFWETRSVAELAVNIRRHFDDLRIDHAPHEADTLSLFRLLVATATQGKAENIPPNLGGELLRSVIGGLPYPQTLLSGAIRRIRAEQEVTYPRAAIIKASLNRYSKMEELKMSLDENNLNPAYRLGRLFAVLERAQERASPNLNATIRDRYYGAASSTPVTVFPTLLKLKNHHVAKLDNKGEAVNLEKLIGQIVDGIDDFPAQLGLHDQGRFAIGYYHQRQAFFTKSDKNEQGE
ncbi:MAG: type I-C CRISPR-associated protein Cas8c/Csd1 [Sulfuricella sp.]|nr:type I-C CRISPR-associated protein Cas8c/Csd1 [Sulfuricella sp.]